MTTYTSEHLQALREALASGHVDLLWISVHMHCLCSRRSFPSFRLGHSVFGIPEPTMLNVEYRKAATFFW